MEITQALHRAAQQTPDLPATIAGERVRTWAECLDRVARLAGALHALGVGPGDRVAMLSLNSDRYHEYLLAVPWAGGVVTPVNIRWSPAEIAFSLEDAGATILLVDDTFVPAVPAVLAAAPVVRTVVHCGDGDVPEGMVSFEALVAGHEPVPDARRGGDEPVRRLLHRRHHRHAQGRHAQPREPARLGAGHRGLRLVHDPGRAPPARRADVPPRRRRRVGGAQRRGRHPRDRPDVHAGRGGRRDGRATRSPTSCSCPR